MAYAELSDVQARLGRPLTTDEQTQVPTLLSDTEILIKARISDLDDKALDDDYLARVKMVEANAVRRLIRNPDGYTSETDGDYTYQINYKLASGDLSITDQEWSLLGATSGISLINLKARTPFESRALTLDPASPEYAVWAMNSDIFWNPL
jgi:hypothetical protein